MCRALSEACQSRLTTIAGARNDLTRDYYPDGSSSAMLQSAARTLSVPFESIEIAPADSGAGETLAADVETLLDRLIAVGCQHAVIVDLTQPALGLPVVKAIVPWLADLDGRHLPRLRRHRDLVGVDG